MRTRKPQSPTYQTWRDMLTRCRNPKSKAYKHYGGRGIQVCSRWLQFRNFLADMGERPKDKTLDRYPDQNGNYEPRNCRWATIEEQRNNSRRNHLVTYKDRTQTLAEWAKELNKPYHVIESRLRVMKWPVERAFTEEVHYKNEVLPRDQRTGRFC